jgi:hypothetical protein
MSELPDAFCWHRYGPEGGMTVEQILRTKELQRQQGGNTFMWGVGQPITKKAIEKLLSTVRPDRPEVLFSPGQPKKYRVKWTRATEVLTGEPYDFPEGAEVISESDRPKPCHYALVCRSERPLASSSPTASPRPSRPTGRPAVPRRSPKPPTT